MLFTQVSTHIVELRHCHWHGCLGVLIVHLFFILSILSFRWLLCLIDLRFFLKVITIVLLLALEVIVIIIASLVLIVISILLILVIVASLLLTTLDIITSILLLLGRLQKKILPILHADHF